MGVIYEPNGAAREYGELAVNLYSGCSHGCKYCFAPSCLHKSREEFNVPIPRKDIIKKIEKEAPKYKGREIFLCFTCDPYQPINDFYNLTGQAIEILHKNEIKVVILTKGGERSEKDFYLLEQNKHLSKYGATLTFTPMNQEKSLKFEPHAALPIERFLALEEAHDRGIETWVSLEPVIDPSETLYIINRTHSYVDSYKIGKLNYHPEAKKVDWTKFVREAVNLLESYNKKYYIKKSLQGHI